MKDLTKGKPSRLILAFALPIFLANLLQLHTAWWIPGLSERFWGRCTCGCRCHKFTEQSDHRLSDGAFQRVCHHHCTAVRSKGSARGEKSFAMSLTLGIAVAAGLTVLGLLFLQPILRF